MPSTLNNSLGIHFALQFAFHSWFPRNTLAQRLPRAVKLGHTVHMCNAMMCNAMMCNAMMCNAMMYNAMMCNAMMCNAMMSNLVLTVSKVEQGVCPKCPFEVGYTVTSRMS